jgi:hypothetical protein
MTKSLIHKVYNFLAKKSKNAMTTVRATMLLLTLKVLSSEMDLAEIVINRNVVFKVPDPQHCSL